MAEDSSGAAARTTAIVLFTDLVGSTELRARLGEDVADEVRHNHDNLVATAVTTHHGRVVKNLGDGVMATFAGARDAVAAAVAVQQAIDRLGRSAGRELLAVRVGLSAGDVAVEAGDCFGTPVIEAARLCAAARGGQVLVSDVVRLLTGAVGGLAFRSVGTVELKGLPEPVAACEVIWQPLPAARMPLPSFLTGAGRIFVGRDEQLGRLVQLWKEAAAGERRVALLGGEPGIGKTRLAAELAARVGDEGAVVLAGRCDEDLGVPYQPFVEALRRYIAVFAGERRLGRHAGELARLVPELAEVEPGLAEPLRSDPETERYRLFDAVAAWLADVSMETPVLLVLDDLQWAAKPTLLLLRHVLRGAGPMRLLVVVTYRDTDIGRADPLTGFLADLRREGGGDRFGLTGLDRAGVGAFMEAVAGHALVDDDAEGFVGAVWEETEGNPFFVTEVIRHLTESGAVAQRDGRWVTTAPLEELGIPEGVRDVVGRRLARLPAGADRVLGVAAVIGLEFEPAVVAVAGGLEEDELFAALEAAAGARLVVEAPGGARYRFAHALVRATLYDEISGPRRVALHRRVAEAIETTHGGRLDDHLPALAHHWARASIPAADADRAVDYATRAGHRALAQLAHDEAAAYYGQALELLDAAGTAAQDGRRQELLIAFGEAQRRAGDPAYRETLLSAARLAQERGDVASLTRAALANTRGGMYSSAMGKVDADRVAVFEAAIACAELDQSSRARILAALGQELLFAGQREARVALSDEALAIARGLDEPKTLALVLLERYFTIYAPATLPERLANTAELLVLCGAIGDPNLTSLAQLIRTRTLGEAGQMEAADQGLDEAERLTDELGQPTLRWLVGLVRTARVIMAGEIEEGERRARAGFELGQATGQLDARAFLVAHLYQVRYEQGRLAELEDQIAAAAEANPGLPLFQAYLALLLCEDGRLDAAREPYERLAGRNFAVPADNGWVLCIPPCAAVCAQLGDRPRAPVLHRMLESYADQVVFTGGGALGSYGYYLGLLAGTMERFEEAEDRFAASAAVHERIGAPAWLARTRMEWAALLLRRGGPGDAARAGSLLDQALATAIALGLGGVERRARQLLIQAGR